MEDTIQTSKASLQRGRDWPAAWLRPYLPPLPHWRVRAGFMQPAVLWPSLAVASALLLWGLSLAGLDPRQMNDLGLVSILRPATYAAALLLTVSFGLSLHRRAAPPAVLLLHVVALIVILHGTPALLYGTLRYSWAWKHVGIVDYIQRYGAVDPTIGTLAAYHNWPGFFALSALVTEMAGFGSALSFAAWAPVFFNLINLGALLLIVETFTPDRRLVWLSVWFFYLTNWVGQDYFAPQAANYFLHLVIIGICLRWLAVPASRTGAKGPRSRIVARVAAWRYGLMSRATPSFAPADPAAGPPLVWTVVVLVLFAVIVSSHQLSPFMTIGGVALLVIFGRCRARSLPILMTALAVAWLVFMARPFMSEQIADLLASFGQLRANVDSNLVDLSQVSAGQKVVAILGRGLTAGLWSLALLGALRRVRHGHWDLTVALLAFAPFLGLIGDSYGGEILFRVYLFSLPFTAFFAASLVYPDSARGTPRPNAALAIVLSSLLLVGFSFAYFGKERQYYFTPGEVRAAAYLYNVAPPNSLLIEGSRNYPAQFRNYERFTYVPISNEPPDGRERVMADPVGVLSRWLDNPNYAATYLILMRSQKSAVEALGVMPRGALDHIERALRKSPQFRVFYATEDATVFVLAPAPSGASR